jgi:iron-sulfur cluster repair protein YtfE (RIC family)
MGNHRQVLSEVTPALDKEVAADHDYVWARLPYLVPMAGKIARRCRQRGDGCTEMAALVAALRSVLLDHLDHEERVLSTLAREADAELVTEGNRGSARGARGAA